MRRWTPLWSSQCSLQEILNLDEQWCVAAEKKFELKECVCFSVVKFHFSKTENWRKFI